MPIIQMRKTGSQGHAAAKGTMMGGEEDHEGQGPVLLRLSEGLLGSRSAISSSLSSGSPTRDPPHPSFSPQHQCSPAKDPLWPEEGPRPRKGTVLPSSKDNS